MKSKQRSGVAFMLAIGLTALSMSSNASAQAVFQWTTVNGSEGKPAYYNEWGYWMQSGGAAINQSGANRIWFVVPNLPRPSGWYRAYANYGGANGQNTCGQAAVLTEDAAFYSATASVCTIPYQLNYLGDMYVPGFGAIMMIFDIPPQGIMTSMQVGML